uniref:Uncharacterized protein n=1 Tax=Haplochromis burtoni TaxID=8153 RepID=A0A3Q2VMJ6_HAPBU
MGKKKVPVLYRAPLPLYSMKVDPDTGLVIKKKNVHGPLNAEPLT